MADDLLVRVRLVTDQVNAELRNLDRKIGKTTSGIKAKFAGVEKAVFSLRGAFAALGAVSFELTLS